MEIGQWFRDKFNSLGQDKVIGLDIGGQTVKLTQVAIEDGIIQLNKLAILETPAGVLDEGELVEVEALADLLSTTLERNDFAREKVVSAISGENVITRTIEVPDMPKEELDDTVNWEAEDQIRLSVDEAVIDYEILDQNANGKYRLLLVAVKQNLVEKYLDLFEKLGLQAAGIETEPIALGRLSKNLHLDKTFCIIDIGYQTTDISVLHKGKLLFTRTINTGGKVITEDIAEDNQITFAKAEEYKKNNNLFLGEQPNIIIRNLTTSIYRSLDYFQVEHEDYELEKIFLTGGSSKLTGYADYLKDQIGVEVEQLKLNRNFRSNLVQTSQNHLREVFPQMLVSIGLALRGEEND